MIITRVAVFLSASLTLFHVKLLNKVELFSENQTGRERMKGPIRDEDGEASLLILIYYFVGSVRQYCRFNSDVVSRNFCGKTAENDLLTMGMFITVVTKTSLREDIFCLNSEYEILKIDLGPCFGPTFPINESVK